MRVPVIKNLAVRTANGSTSWVLDKTQTNAHIAFFYIECVCNAWFTLEIMVTFAPPPNPSCNLPQKPLLCNHSNGIKATTIPFPPKTHAQLFVSFHAARSDSYRRRAAASSSSPPSTSSTILQR